MAIAVTNTQANSGTTSNSTTPFTFSYTSSGNALIILIASKGGVNSVTFGGVALTKLGGGYSTSIYALINPVAGAGTVSILQGGYDKPLAVDSISLSGVKPSGYAQPSVSFYANDNNGVSLSMGSITPGSIMFDVAAIRANVSGISQGAGQTLLSKIDNFPSRAHAHVSSYKFGATDMAFTRTAGSWEATSYLAVEILKEVFPPVVTTGSASDLFSSTVQINGSEVTSEGDESVTERGIVYNTSANPEITDTKLVVGAGAGTFDASLTGLDGETLYYARAFATSSIGTSYGSEVSFTTDINAAMPIMMADNPVNFNTPIIL